MSTLVLITVLLVSGVTGARAHEVQPAVADFVIGEERLDLTIRMTLEAPLAGVDLAGLADTNEAANSDLYDEKRRMSPEEIAAELNRSWPAIAARITLMAGETRLAPELLGADVPPVGNPEVARFSVVRIAADLPPGEEPLVIGWDGSLGGLILRQQGIDDGYTAYLQDGDLSDPIPRSGGSGQTAWNTALDYVLSGYDHIIPKGLDHILFVLGLFFFALAWRPLLWQVSAFTLAHTVTLALATLGIIQIPAEWMWLVEAFIALSISWVAIENLFRPALGWFRPAIVFGFGLLHGLGFASVLGDVGLPQGQFVVALIAFNVGVELGQLSVILAAFLVILAAGWAASVARLDDEELVVVDTPVMYRAVALTGSILIAIVGLYWFFERIGVLNL
ncbi:HupE/UreJ family protein [Ovoidimarina sediminis]|uniref:HupE/UreJ family protein n=1 Tax=Ovoidimarina sediminis TaxID=3079856 RepID=UPI00290F151E|nr:HupE/UreJ family protein [Rhodophyticola sp. MJ-SS7]MDU8942753.1 HupE/UreJ family protein [Rhodophyticola sp. MJ-SS7]